MAQTVMTHKQRETSSCLHPTSGRTWRRRRRSAARVNMVGVGGGGSEGGRVEVCVGGWVEVCV